MRTFAVHAGGGIPLPRPELQFIPVLFDARHRANTTCLSAVFERPFQGTMRQQSARSFMTADALGARSSKRPSTQKDSHRRWHGFPAINDRVEPMVTASTTQKSSRAPNGAATFFVTTKKLCLQSSQEWLTYFEIVTLQSFANKGCCAPNEQRRS